MSASLHKPMPQRSYYVYITASPSRTLYTGVTSNLETRIYQHKNKEHKGFPNLRLQSTRLLRNVRKPRSRHRPRKATQRMDKSEEDRTHRKDQLKLDRPQRTVGQTNHTPGKRDVIVSETPHFSLSS
jgi:predicted GIY-YIG superfamily endonuclease